jgi:hypothetical protein
MQICSAVLELLPAQNGTKKHGESNGFIFLNMRCQLASEMETELTKLRTILHLGFWHQGVFRNSLPCTVYLTEVYLTNNKPFSYKVSPLNSNTSITLTPKHSRNFRNFPRWTENRSIKRKLPLALDSQRRLRKQNKNLVSWISRRLDPRMAVLAKATSNWTDWQASLSLRLLWDRRRPVRKRIGKLRNLQRREPFPGNA